MNFTEYEQHVASILRAEGWKTQLTPPSRDGGIDVLAERGASRLAVQAKMYGTSTRPINSQIVRELYGAACGADCTAYMIATDGRVLADAQVTADKLGVEIRHIAATQCDSARLGTGTPTQTMTFDQVWNEHVAALEGRTLIRENGSTNKILTVDGGGVVRLTSGGTKQRLEIEIFRWTIERLLVGKVVTRSEIDARWIKRGSSGIVLILSHLDPFEPTTIDGKKAIRLAVDATC